MVLHLISQGTSTKELKLLNPFFANNEGRCVLYFLQNVLCEIQKGELQLQRSYTTIVDLHFIITNLINKLRQKLCDKYYGNDTRLVLDQLKESDKIKSEELMKAFDLFINTVIDYIKSYFDHDSRFYEKLSYFNVQSFHFLTWKNVLDVVDLIQIDDLDMDQLYSEFCDIKFLYDNLNKKNIKLSDQVKSYISSKRINFSASSISHHIVVCDDGDSDNEEVISSSNNQDEDLIRSDQLWAYLLNINPNSTPNFKKIISYIFSLFHVQILMWSQSSAICIFYGPIIVIEWISN